MKATARLITGNLRATAQIVGGIAGQAFAQPSGVTASARTTDESGTRTFIEVAPVEPQQLVWLIPQYGVDYTVTTSTGLHWQIK